MGKKLTNINRFALFFTFEFHVLTGEAFSFAWPFTPRGGENKIKWKKLFSSVQVSEYVLKNSVSSLSLAVFDLIFF